jgi:hypothetical protein
MVRTIGADGVDGGSGGRPGEQGVEVAEVLLEFAKLAGIGGWCSVVDAQRELRFLLFELAFEDLAGSGDGVALIV